MAMKPIKLKDLLTQTKEPVTQQIEIMEDYVLSVKTMLRMSGTKIKKKP